jgi:hypothetical protein
MAIVRMDFMFVKGAWDLMNYLLKVLEGFVSHFVIILRMGGIGLITRIIVIITIIITIIVVVIIGIW